VPIIALTSQSDIGSVQACMSVGMNEVMVKPVQGGSLYACLTRQFAQQRGGGNGGNDGAAVEARRSPTPLDSANAQKAILDNDLLDTNHLRELAALGLIDETFASGIEQIGTLISQLRAHAADRDLDATHGALHLLLGASGNIGAKALHQYTRQIYPRTLEGAWPAEPDWLERIGELGQRSTEALRRYLDPANARPGLPESPGDPASASANGIAMREH
jgi:HPt (histidine-containing phosphotransfer) domain-containing protein